MFTNRKHFVTPNNYCKTWEDVEEIKINIKKIGRDFKLRATQFLSAFKVCFYIKTIINKIVSYNKYY